MTPFERRDMPYIVIAAVIVIVLALAAYYIG
jgi:hypothetical protein